MYSISASIDYGDEIRLTAYVVERTEDSGREYLFRYEELLRTGEGAEPPACPMSALSQLEMFLARAQHALDGVS